jgi:hypothetical protein
VVVSVGAARIMRCVSLILRQLLFVLVKFNY